MKSSSEWFMIYGTLQGKKVAHTPGPRARGGGVAKQSIAIAPETLSSASEQLLKGTVAPLIQLVLTEGDHL